MFPSPSPNQISLQLPTSHPIPSGLDITLPQVLYPRIKKKKNIVKKKTPKTAAILSCLSVETSLKGRGGGRWGQKPKKKHSPDNTVPKNPTEVSMMYDVRKRGEKKKTVSPISSNPSKNKIKINKKGNPENPEEVTNSKGKRKEKKNA